MLSIMRAASQVSGRSSANGTKGTYLMRHAAEEGFDFLPGLTRPLDVNCLVRDLWCSVHRDRTAGCVERRMLRG